MAEKQITLQHEGIKGTFTTTEKAYERVWKAKGWQPAEQPAEATAEAAPAPAGAEPPGRRTPPPPAPTAPGSQEA